MSDVGGQWRPYPLWGGRGDWCNEEVVGVHAYTDAIRSTLGSDFDPGGTSVRRTVELIPEPGNPHDRYAVSVRASNYLIGYLARERAILFHSRLAELIKRGWCLQCRHRSVLTTATLGTTRQELQWSCLSPWRFSSVNRIY